MAGRPRSDPSARVKPDSCWFRAWRELESWACAARQSSAGLGRSDPLAYHGRPRPTQRQNGADGGLGEKFGLRCQLPSGSVTKRQASWRRRPARAGAWVHTSVQTAGRACPNAGRCLAGNVGPCRDGGAGRADSAIRHSGPALKGAAALGAGAAAVTNSGPHSVLQLGPAGLLRASSATRAKPALRVFCRAAPPPHKRSSSSSVPPLLQVGICPYVKQQRSLSQFARPPSPPSPTACLRLSSCFRPSTSPRKQAMPRAAASLRVLVRGRIAAAANGG